MKTLRILHLSDLHGILKILWKIIASGQSFDWIVLSGDIAPTHVKYMTLLANGFRKIDREAEGAHQLKWALNALKPLIDRIPHRVLIIVNGNHDFCDFSQAFPNAITQFKGARVVEVDGLQVGLAVGISPLIKEWHEELEEFDFNELLHQLGPNINVLITHAPPNQVLDSNYGGQHIGYNCLYSRLFGSALRQEYPFFKHLFLHLFGHAHESNGMKEIEIEANEQNEARTILFSNASGGANVIEQEIQETGDKPSNQ
jgi:Icc-related predicted phosphoesterase